MKVVLDPKSKFFTLELIVTDKCNYDCSFCKMLHDNKSVVSFDWVTAENINNLIDTVRRTIDLPISINLYGGEPLLIPQMGEVINGIYDDVIIELSTNLYRTIPEFSKDNVKICATWHPEFQSFNNFLANALSIKDNIFMLPIMYTADYNDVNYNTLIDIFADGVVTIIPIMDFHTNIADDFYVRDTDIDDSTLQNTQYFHKFMDFDGQVVSIYDMYKIGANRFKGTMCECRSHKLTVDIKGFVHPCTNHMFKMRDGVHINDLIELDTTDMICEYEFCCCDMPESGRKYLEK